MNKVLSLFLIVITLVMLVPTPRPDPVTAQDGLWRVVSARSIRSIFEELEAPEAELEGIRIGRGSYLPAPDGRHVAYEKNTVTEEERQRFREMSTEERQNSPRPGTIYMCTLDIVTIEERCIEIPPEINYGVRPDTAYPSARWSPDSTRLVSVGEPVMNRHDTDLILYDFQAASYANLTDDGYQGRYLSEDDEPVPAGVYMPFQPVFSPDGTQIAVERSAYTADGFLPSTISLVDARTGEVRDLANLPGYQPDFYDLGTTFGLTWSPDGNTLAAGFFHLLQTGYPDYDGIWLIDANTGEKEQLVTWADAKRALGISYPIEASTNDLGPSFYGLSWSPDGSRLLFWASGYGSYYSTEWCFWADVATGAVTPVPLPAHSGDNDEFRAVRPRQVIWSPDGSHLLIAAHQEARPANETFTPLDPSIEEGNIALYLIDVDTKRLTVLGHLAQRGPLAGQGYWDPDNDVIIADYYLKFAHD